MTQKYIENFVRFAERAERYIRRVLFTLLALLLISQILLQFPVIRQFAARVELYEGIPFNDGLNELYQHRGIPVRYIGKPRAYLERVTGNGMFSVLFLCNGCETMV